MRGTDRPTLLYITPVTPAETGNGLAMRAANVLRVLVRHYQITVLILPIYPSGPSGDLPKWVRKQTKRIVRSVPDVRNQRFDIVHLFRLVTLDIAEQELIPANIWQWHIDLDDVESRLPGSTTADIERRVLENWDRVYVCSEDDRTYLDEQVPGHRAEIVVLPNAVAVPETVVPPPNGMPRHLLMTGTLGYQPNAEGAIWFCREVLPIIREATPVPVEVSLVGPGAPQEVLDLHYLPEVRHIGPVPEMAPWYRRADIVLAPILVGGGTRIKVLEALAFGRPVVSTRTGAQGLDLADGHDLLLADRPQPFAQCCLELIRNPAVGHRIATQGRETVARQYGHQAVVDGFTPAVLHQSR